MWGLFFCLFLLFFTSDKLQLYPFPNKWHKFTPLYNWINLSIMHLSHIFFIHVSTGSHWGWFRSLPTVSSPARSIDVQVVTWYIGSESLVFKPRSRYVYCKYTVLVSIVKNILELIFNSLIVDNWVVFFFYIIFVLLLQTEMPQAFLVAPCVSTWICLHVLTS